ncbi:crossover junction endonuclease EME1-like isoform X2 [Gigantopelta aegis]|uniref:crossover junction endonuclease EME1-like isoform X2 n=1 Tax=Gigantopelta aegis TaxID=1735272 RepID=UPI001B88C5B5|nr:crossover junction endonuclease EME1-like isoform X2 [Gigantopelta aegis]
MSRAVTATSFTSVRENDSVTDINSDSDADLPIIARRKDSSHKDRNEKLSPSLNLIQLHSDEVQSKNDSLSTTDINSDNELPDIDYKSFTDEIDGTMFGENNNKHVSTHMHVNSVNQEVTDSVALKTGMEKHNNLFARCSDLDSGYVNTYSKTIVALTNSSIPVEISDNSNDSNSNYSNSCTSVSDKLDIPASLSERCKLKMNVGDKVFNERRISKSDKVFNEGRVSKSKETHDDVTESLTHCDMLPDIEMTSDPESYNPDDYAVPNVPDIPVQKKKTVKRRTPEEIAESRRQAELRKAERQQEKENKKAEKEREKQQKKIEQQSKRHYKAGDCVKFMTVCVDPGIINNNAIAAHLFKVCSELDAQCLTETQLIPNSITWRREVIDTSQFESEKKQVTEDNVLTMIPVSDFVEMVHTHALQQHGNLSYEGLTVREYIESVQTCHDGRDVSVFVLGMERYFNDQKLSAKRQHRDAVSLTGGSDVSKAKKQKTNKHELPTVSRIELEEALVDAQLHTGCIVKLLDTGEDVANLVKTFTKAVADKPVKKDRLTNPFNFLEEGTAGVKVDKNGCGLLKVWKHQLLQFQHLGPDMAEAIIAAYPSPRMLIEAYRHCLKEKDAQRLLENIVVRRGAGVLVTNRRIGKELSKRIHSFITSRDPSFVIK